MSQELLQKRDGPFHFFTPSTRLMSGIALGLLTLIKPSGFKNLIAPAIV